MAAASAAGKSESLNDALSWQEKVDGGAFYALLRSMDRRSEAKANSDFRLAWSLTAQARQWEVGQRPALSR